MARQVHEHTGSLESVETTASEQTAVFEFLSDDGDRYRMTFPLSELEILLRDKCPVFMHDDGKVDLGFLEGEDD